MQNFNEELLFLDRNASLPLFELYCAGITHPDPTYRIRRPRGVNFYTIEYVKSGHGHIHFQNSTISPEPFDAYVLPPRVPVDYQSDTSSPWEKMWINIGGPLPEHLFKAYNLQNIVLFRNCSIETELQSILNILQNPLQHDSILQISLSLHRILAKLAMHQQQTNAPRRNSLAVKLRLFLEEHWKEHIRLSDLAAHINRSPVQTLRIFSREWGCSPEEWLQRRRFEIAQRYLSNTNLTIRNIAEIAGFKDIFYFSNWFKRKSGMAPGKYRRTGDGESG